MFFIEIPAFLFPVLADTIILLSLLRAVQGVRAYGWGHVSQRASPPFYFARVVASTRQWQFAPKSCTWRYLVHALSPHVSTELNPRGRGGEAGSLVNPADPFCTLLPLFRATDDPGIGFPLCM